MHLQITQNQQSHLLFFLKKLLQQITDDEKQFLEEKHSMPLDIFKTTYSSKAVLMEQESTVLQKLRNAIFEMKPDQQKYYLLLSISDL